MAPNHPEAPAIDCRQNVLIVNGRPTHVDDRMAGLVGVMYIDELHPPIPGEAAASDVPGSTSVTAPLIIRAA